jgi:hypothetical protein
MSLKTDDESFARVAGLNPGRAGFSNQNVGTPERRRGGIEKEQHEQDCIRRRMRTIIPIVLHET